MLNITAKTDLQNALMVQILSELNLIDTDHVHMNGHQFVILGDEQKNALFATLHREMKSYKTMVKLAEKQSADNLQELTDKSNALNALFYQEMGVMTELEQLLTDSPLLAPLVMRWKNGGEQRLSALLMEAITRAMNTPDFHFETATNLAVGKLEQPTVFLADSGDVLTLGDTVQVIGEQSTYRIQEMFLDDRGAMVTLSAPERGVLSYEIPLDDIRKVNPNGSENG